MTENRKDCLNWGEVQWRPNFFIQACKILIETKYMKKGCSECKKYQCVLGKEKDE